MNGIYVLYFVLCALVYAVIMMCLDDNTDI